MSDQDEKIRELQVLLKGADGDIEMLSRLRKRLEAQIVNMQAAVARYVNAQGPHMTPSWKEFFVSQFGLVIDEGNPYRPVKIPVEQK